jgi:hypothetical protein
MARGSFGEKTERIVTEVGCHRLDAKLWRGRPQGLMPGCVKSVGSPWPTPDAPPKRTACAPYKPMDNQALLAE